MEKRGEPVDGYGTIWMVIGVDSLFHWELQYLCTGGRHLVTAVLAQQLDSIFARNTVGKASKSKLFQIPLRKG